MRIRNLAFVVAGLALAPFASAATIYGVTNSNNLLTFNSATPGTIDSSIHITGLSGENVLGIDFRPNGELFGITDGNRAIKIDLTSGAATTVGTGLGLILNGTAFGFDFNPVIDRLRVVSETDRNYVIDPNTGLATAATNLAYGPADPNFGVNPNVTASAYSNNNIGAATTQLYGLDTNLDILVTQANSAGTLGTVGPLGVNATAVTGFDIERGTGIAYAALIPAVGTPSGVSNLYSISLLTGLATNLGQIDGGLNIVDITVALPEPTTLAALGGASLLLGRRRRA
jgi:hypothetical protein